VFSVFLETCIKYEENAPFGQARKQGKRRKIRNNVNFKLEGQFKTNQIDYVPIYIYIYIYIYVCVLEMAAGSPTIFDCHSCKTWRQNLHIIEMIQIGKP
jgi:hypothetical protein